MSITLTERYNYQLEQLPGRRYSTGSDATSINAKSVRVVENCHGFDSRGGGRVFRLSFAVQVAKNIFKQLKEVEIVFYTR